ncbi:ribosome maturation factor RimM [Desulfofalx alkaliphila]|uniref:ribosome maturation factor RimM n=1 Tax=Desulfofalx alkaliphila TaxID=105483 RepID=UPI0004E1F09F|nr:ribosome maturation factor RimM [Desulfofalx alkaliphila]
MEQQYITIGEIVNTQGRKGEVRLIPLTDFLDRFNDLDELQVYLKDKRFTVHLEAVRRHKNFIILKFKGIDDINEAEKLKGGLAQITKDKLVPLPEGSYYIFQIVGLDVFTESGEKLGTVTEVLRTGANDVYVTKPPVGKDILIPALKSVVKEINIEANRMVVELPEGLLDT